MGAIVVALVAVSIMLVFGAVAVGVRLVGSLRQLLAAVNDTQRLVQPAIVELGEAGQVASLELAQLQAGIANLQRSGSVRQADG